MGEQGIGSYLVYLIHPFHLKLTDGVACLCHYEHGKGQPYLESLRLSTEMSLFSYSGRFLFVVQSVLLLSYLWVDRLRSIPQFKM